MKILKTYYVSLFQTLRKIKMIKEITSLLRGFQIKKKSEFPGIYKCCYQNENIKNLNISLTNGKILKIIPGNSFSISIKGTHAEKKTISFSIENETFILNQKDLNEIENFEIVITVVDKVNIKLNITGHYEKIQICEDIKNETVSI